MCELIIEVKAPYNITLFIDNYLCSSDEKGVYKINIAPNIKHTMKLIIEKPYIKRKNNFIKKFFNKKQKEEVFDDLIYLCGFKLDKNHNNAKLMLKYQKIETLNLNNDVVKIPHIIIIKSKNMIILNENNSIFKNKINEFFYFMKQMYLILMIFSAGSSVFLYDLLYHLINYFNGKEFSPFIRDLAFNYESAFVIYSVFFLILFISLICIVFVFYKKFKRMQLKTAQ